MSEDQEIVLRIVAKNLTSAEFQKAREELTGLTEGTKKQSAVNKEGELSAYQLRSALMSAFRDPVNGIKNLASSVTADLVGGLNLATVAMAATGAAVGLAMGHMVVSATRTTAELNDFADTLSLSARGASELSYIAQVTGMSLQALERAVFMAQRQMENNPKEFGEGLKAIHLSFQALQGLSPEQQLYRISAAFQQYTDQTNRAAVATKLYGRGSQEMIPILMKDMSAMAAESKNYTETDLKRGQAWAEGWGRVWAAVKREWNAGGLFLMEQYDKLKEKGIIKDVPTDAENDVRFNRLGPPPAAPGVPAIFAGGEHAPGQLSEQTKFFDLSMRAAAQLTEAQQKQIEADLNATYAKRELARVVTPLNSEQEKLARTALASGHSMELVADAVGRTTGDLKLLQRAWEEEDRATKNNARGKEDALRMYQSLVDDAVVPWSLQALTVVQEQDLLQKQYNESVKAEGDAWKIAAEARANYNKMVEEAVVPWSLERTTPEDEEAAGEGAFKAGVKNQKKWQEGWSRFLSRDLSQSITRAAISDSHQWRYVGTMIGGQIGGSLTQAIEAKWHTGMKGFFGSLAGGFLDFGLSFLLGKLFGSFESSKGPDPGLPPPSPPSFAPGRPQTTVIHINALDGESVRRVLPLVAQAVRQNADGIRTELQYGLGIA